MSLKGFGLFAKLTKGGRDLAALGLHGTAGDVLRLSNRIRIVKAFRGLNLEGIGSRTAKGYDALMQVFLTHSALEQFLQVTNQKAADLEPAHRARGSERLFAEIFDTDDGKGRLFEFLHKRLNKHLQEQLTKCREKKCANVAFVAASIRHIFVHGHLTANPNGMKPEPVYRICKKVSDFLIEFMDDEFFSRVTECARGKKV